MRYMVLMYSDPAATEAMSASDRDAVARKHQALRTELTESGELLNGAGLAYPAGTRTMRLRGRCRGHRQWTIRERQGAPDSLLLDRLRGPGQGPVDC